MARRKEQLNQPAPVARELSKGAKAAIAIAVILVLLGILTAVAFVLG